VTGTRGKLMPFLGHGESDGLRYPAGNLAAPEDSCGPLSAGVGAGGGETTFVNRVVPPTALGTLGDSPVNCCPIGLLQPRSTAQYVCRHGGQARPLDSPLGSVRPV